jgi:HEPN domain-containing protein
MPDRSADWFRQAQRDLTQAEASLQDERHEWACFAAHQAAEKAVKALHLFYQQEAWGHVVSRLLAELPADIQLPPLLSEKAKVLDTFYIPTHYPDSHPDGSPFEHYGVLQSREAVNYAREILTFVGNEMAQPERG